MAEQKKAPSTNGEFKTSPLGFDKAEVMAYIVQHNKERKALKEENEELKRALEEKQQTNEGQSNELTAELEKKKAELDAQILESRKQVRKTQAGADRKRTARYAGQILCLDRRIHRIQKAGSCKNR